MVKFVWKSMENNSSLTGAVIAQDFSIDNGGKSTVRFDPDFPQDIPFDITSPIEIENPGGPTKKLKIGRTNER